jgi:hydroxymethylbilane synthase
LNHSKIIRIGTRGSPLALAQSGIIQNQLAQAWPDHTFELVSITTSGDLLQTDSAKPSTSTKAIFTKEIEEALLNGRIDLAVHSAKDLAAQIPPDLCLGAVPKRVSPCDMLILKADCSIDSAKKGIILTSSARRQSQWINQYPESSIEPIRGNIDTRLKKLLAHPNAQGLILAEAGLQRLSLDLSAFSLHPLPPHLFVPAPGQGTLALQCRTQDHHTQALLAPLNHPETALTLRAERAFLSAMNAGCNIPLGAYAWLQTSTLHLDVFFDPSNLGPVLRKKISGASDEPEKIALNLAKEFPAP